MKKILFALFINIPFVIFSSVSSQQKNRIMYADMVINEMRTRLAFEKHVDHIICYQGVDSQGNTIVHNLIISIAQGLNGQKNQRELLKHNIDLLNKLSSYFSEFRNKKNNDQKTPFDIIFEDGKCINIAGSVKNFKALLPTEKVNVSQESCQRVKSEKRSRGTLAKGSLPAESKSVLACDDKSLIVSTELDQSTDLFHQQKTLYMKKNMGILFESQSLPEKN